MAGIFDTGIFDTGIFDNAGTGPYGTMAVTETGSDTASMAGKVFIKGALSVTETGNDLFTSAGAVKIQGVWSSTETGTDTISASGKVLVKGSLDATEQADTISVSGTVSNGFTITGAQALLLFKLYQLHGLAKKLTVSSTARSTGDISQSITDSSGTITIATTSFGTDTLSGDVGTMIEELANLHGLNTSLVVTSSTRDAGTISQTISTAGGITEVVRL